MSRNSLNLRTASLFFVFLLALTACSNTAPPGIAADSSSADTSTDVPDEIAMAETDPVGLPDSQDLEDSPEDTLPSEEAASTKPAFSLGDVAEEPNDPVENDESVANEAPSDVTTAPSSRGRLPRTTAEGILLTAETTDFDFGDGDVPSLEITADSPSGLAGIYIALDDLVADTSSIGMLRWVGSGDTLVILAEAGPSVDRVRLASSLGGVDETEPNDSGLAVLAVIYDDLANLTLEGFDANGNLVAECEPDDVFFNCPWE